MDVDFEKYLLGKINYSRLSDYFLALEIPENHSWKNNPYHRQAILNFEKYFLDKKTTLEYGAIFGLIKNVYIDFWAANLNIVIN